MGHSVFTTLRTGTVWRIETYTSIWPFGRTQFPTLLVSPAANITHVSVSFPNVPVSFPRKTCY